MNPYRDDNRAEQWDKMAIDLEVAERRAVAASATADVWKLVGGISFAVLIAVVMFATVALLHIAFPSTDIDALVPR